MQYSTIDLESITGDELGKTAKPVKPPAKAALETAS
jgi:hypothetical protein